MPVIVEHKLLLYSVELINQLFQCAIASLQCPLESLLLLFTLIPGLVRTNVAVTPAQSLRIIQRPVS